MVISEALWGQVISGVVTIVGTIGAVIISGRRTRRHVDKSNEKAVDETVSKIEQKMLQRASKPVTIIAEIPVSVEPEVRGIL